MLKKTLFSAFFCVLFFALNAQVMQETQTSQSTRRFVIREGFRLPLACNVSGNPNLLNYSTGALSRGALVYDTCDNKVKKWNGTDWETLGVDSVFIDSLVPKTRSITGVKSLTGGGDLSVDRTIELVNDLSSPSANSFYGTNNSGLRGYNQFPSHSYFGISNRPLGVPQYNYDSVTSTLTILANRTASNPLYLDNNMATMRVRSDARIGATSFISNAINGGLVWEPFGWTRRQLVSDPNQRSVTLTGNIGTGTLMNTGDNLNFFAVYDSGGTRPFVFSSALNQFVVSINSHRRALLIPRINTTRMNVIGAVYADAGGGGSLQSGMILYNTDSNKLCYSTPSGWVCLSGTANCMVETKNVTIKDPSSSENYTLFYTTDSVSIQRIDEVVIGSSPSITYNISYSSTRDGTFTNVMSSDKTVTSESGTNTTSFSSPNIPANRWLRITTSAKSGTVDEFHITIRLNVCR